MTYQNYFKSFNISDHTSVYFGGVSNTSDWPNNDLIEARKGFSWTKPKNSKFIAIFYVAAGGGGGGGCATPSGVAAGGGGGGAAAQAGFVLYPAFIVPDYLRIKVGVGGGGGAGGFTDGVSVSAASNGSVGSSTYLTASVGDNSERSTVFIRTDRTNAGNAGTSSAGGFGGNSNVQQLSHCALGIGYDTALSDQIMNFQSGGTGSISTQTTANNDFGSSYAFLGGAGGGGVTSPGVAFSGGSVTYGGNLTEYSFNRITKKSASGTDGENAFSNFLEIVDRLSNSPRMNDILKGMKLISGSGGGGNVNGNGGRGGDGGVGCGGGGGGAAQGTNVSGGRGGNGGPGMVIITSIF